MNPIIKKNGIIIGVILAIINILITCYLYFFKNESIFTNLVIGVVSMFLIVAFGIISILVNKKKLNGFITFKEAFSGYFMTIFTSSLLCFVFSFVFFNAIANEIKTNKIKKEMVEFQIKLLKENNSSKEEILKTRKSAKGFNPFSFFSSITSALKYLLRDIVIGLFVALVFRNKIVPVV